MLAITKPEVLIPADGHEKWSVVACDQFTSEPKYWQRLEQYVGDAPSCLRIIFPEVYLGNDDEKRIESINATMAKYVSTEGFFKKINAYILVERTVGDTKRLGLMTAVDLDSYDPAPFADVPVKATEGTIYERIPPRVKIRENAPLELTHIMLLMDDRKKSVNERLYAMRDEFEVAYDFDLSMDGGHLKGYVVNDEKLIQDALSVLDNSATKRALYGKDTNMTFAVGDGNHSLLTAKTVWENVKQGLTNEERMRHPARYALVELVNVYDEGLVFEPIHRVIFNPSEEFKAMLKSLTGNNIVRTTEGNLTLDGTSAEMIKTIQDVVEDGIKRRLFDKVDYVHGDDNLVEIVRQNKGALGIFMPKIDKEELFPYVLTSGVLPKKAFSMGNANEKRYYMEARVIKEL